jgi:hypothetical protein
MDDLEKRVQQFQTLQLPGQPIGMHMGTANLVNDLWRELKKTSESEYEWRVKAQILIEQLAALKTQLATANRDADALAKIVQEAHDDYIDKVGESEGTNEMEAALSAHEARKAE